MRGTLLKKKKDTNRFASYSNTKLVFKIKEQAKDLFRGTVKSVCTMFLGCLEDVVEADGG